VRTTKDFLWILVLKSGKLNGWPRSLRLSRCRARGNMSVHVGPCTLCAAIGDRAFPAAAASVWISLLESVRPSPSLTVFRSSLKMEFLLGLTAAPAITTDYASTTT